MAIVSVTEDLPSGPGTFSLEERGYTRNFNVLTDSFDDNAITVINHVDLPSFYEIFDKGNDTDPQAVVTAIDPQRDSVNPLLWRILYTYSVLRPDDGGGAPPGELTIEGTLPAFSISERYEDRPRLTALQRYTVDVDPVPPLLTTKPGTMVNLRNFAKDLYQDQPYYRETIRVITCRRYFRRYADLLAADIGTEDRINLTAWWGIPSGQLKCLGMPGGVRMADNFGTYWETDMVFEWKRDGWWEEFAEVGFQELYDDAGTERKRRIQDANGQFVTEPVELWTDGGKQTGSTKTTLWSRYQVYLALDFATIMPALPPIDVSFPSWP